MEAKGFIKLVRGDSAMQIAQHPNALCLLTYIALHASRNGRWIGTPKLEKGEAMIGCNCISGMTRSAFRHSLSTLIDSKLISIRTTNKGTIAKLLDSTVYDINSEASDHHSDHHSDHPTTIKQPSSDHPTTTNKKGKNVKNVIFTKPTAIELDEYINANNMKCESAAFLDHFNSNGWKVGGKAPMKDWKAAVRNWDRNRKDKASSNTLTNIDNSERRTREDYELDLNS